MKLLKSRRGWVMLRNANIGDDIPEPDKYPCYVYFTVKSWGYEIKQAIYLYAEDVEFMNFQIKKASE